MKRTLIAKILGIGCLICLGAMMVELVQTHDGLYFMIGMMDLMGAFSCLSII